MTFSFNTHISNRRNIVFSTLFLLFLFTSGNLYSQNLFNAVEEDTKKENPHAVQKIKTYRSNKLNKQVTKIKINDLKAISKDGKLKLSVPGDNEIYTAHALYVEAPDDDNYQWNGKILDKEKREVGSVTLSSINSAVFGEINIHARTFVIEDLGEASKNSKKDRTTYLIERDSEQLQQHTCGTDDSKEEEEHPDPRIQSKVEMRSSICTRNVRVLVLFTTAANNAANGIQSATTFINQSNQALRNSGITAEELTFQLASAQLFNGIDDQIIVNNGGQDPIAAQTLRALLNQLNANAQVETIRANLDADLVVLLTNNQTITNGGFFGVGNLHNLNLRTQAHSVTQIVDAGRFTFAHEMAHNMGCKHDGDNNLANGLTAYARGRMWMEGNIGRSTVMAFAPGNERIQFFSNPNVSFNNIPTGENNRNNARQLREQALKISNYEVGSDPVQAIVSGPSTVYSPSDSYTWCASTCNTNISSYLWAWSPDGFTYYNLGTSSCLSAFGSTFNTTATTIFLRLIATHTNNQTSTTILPVTNNQNNQYIVGGSELLSLAGGYSQKSLQKMSLKASPNPTFGTFDLSA
jgi:Metallo-peptidase family M12B Reprolysin-like